MNCKKCGAPVSGFLRRYCEKCAKENVAELEGMKGKILGEFVPEHKSFKLNTSKSATRLSLMVITFIILEGIARYFWSLSWIIGLVILIVVATLFYYPVLKKIFKKENNTSEQKPLTE